MELKSKPQSSTNLKVRHLDDLWKGIFRCSEDSLNSVREITEAQVLIIQFELAPFQRVLLDWTVIFLPINKITVFVHNFLPHEIDWHEEEHFMFFLYFYYSRLIDRTVVTGLLSAYTQAMLSLAIEEYQTEYCPEPIILEMGCRRGDGMSLRYRAEALRTEALMRYEDKMRRNAKRWGLREELELLEFSLEDCYRFIPPPVSLVRPIPIFPACKSYTSQNFPEEELPSFPYFESDLSPTMELQNDMTVIRPKIPIASKCPTEPKLSLEVSRREGVSLITQTERSASVRVKTTLDSVTLVVQLSSSLKSSSSCLIDFEPKRTETKSTKWTEIKLDSLAKSFVTIVSEGLKRSVRKEESSPGPERKRKRAM